MKLGCASEGSITECKSYVQWSLIHEHETAPTWSFDYGKYRNDPSPKILVLGSYVHPNSGNNLIGGINLNYLSPRQKLILRKNLPRLLRAENLYTRYHLGRALMPGIFDDFYRTYNPSYIRGLTQDVIIPEIPKDQAASDLIRHRLDKINKSKAKRQQEYMPKYPSDISDMQKNIEKKTDQILKQPADELVPTSAPEVRAAKINKIKQQKQEDQPESVAIPGLERDLEQGKAAGYIAPEPDIVTKPETKAEIEDEANEAQEDLESPDDVEDPLGLEESLIYYDPRSRRYIIEPAYSLVSEWKPKYR